MTTSTDSRIDAGRLTRALGLTAKPIDGDAWIVSGGERSHVVRDGYCDCPDATTRRVECKHLLAIRLAALDPEILQALRGLIAHTPVARSFPLTSRRR